jgi:hypothetical protein
MMMVHTLNCNSPQTVSRGLANKRGFQLTFGANRRACEPTLTANEPTFGSWPHLVIQGREGMMAPREQKGGTSKIPGHQRRNEPPLCHRLAHHLAFTKSAHEPEFKLNSGDIIKQTPRWNQAATVS